MDLVYRRAIVSSKSTGGKMPRQYATKSTSGRIRATGRTHDSDASTASSSDSGSGSEFSPEPNPIDAQQREQKDRELQLKEQELLQKDKELKQRDRESLQKHKELDLMVEMLEIKKKKQIFLEEAIKKLNLQILTLGIILFCVLGCIGLYTYLRT